MRAKGWTCQRVSKGVVCKQHNPPRTRKCIKCDKPRPARRHPEHLSALDLSYEEYVKLNGGETCGICGRRPSARRRLDRDHDHVTGQPRGLLCARCNRALPAHITIEWMCKAIKYLQKAARHV